MDYQSVRRERILGDTTPAPELTDGVDPPVDSLAPYIYPPTEPRLASGELGKEPVMSVPEVAGSVEKGRLRHIGRRVGTLAAKATGAITYMATAAYLAHDVISSGNTAHFDDALTVIMVAPAVMGALNTLGDEGRFAKTLGNPGYGIGSAIALGGTELLFTELNHGKPHPGRLGAAAVLAITGAVRSKFRVTNRHDHPAEVPRDTN